MKKISYWAKLHPRTARAAIVGIKLTLAAMAYWLGAYLIGPTIDIPLWLIYSGMALLVIIVLCYPSPRSGVSYPVRKSFDFTVCLLTFFLIAASASQPLFFAVSSMASKAVVPVPEVTAQQASPSAGSSSIPLQKNYPDNEAGRILKSLEHRDKSELTRKEKRILRQEFKTQLKAHVKARITGDQEQSDQTLLIILTIVGAVGLTLLLSALACNIACSGAEGLAIVLFIVGLAAIVLGAIAIIRRINRGPGSPSEPRDPIGTASVAN